MTTSALSAPNALPWGTAWKTRWRRTAAPSPLCCPRNRAASQMRSLTGALVLKLSPADRFFERRRVIGLARNPISD